MLMLVMTTTGGAGQDTGSSSVVRILAVFQSIRNGNDGTGHAQDPDCTQQRENGLDEQQWKWWWWTMESFIKQRDRCQQRHIIHQQQENKEQMVWRPTLALLPV
jgi:hypothetical protein